MHPRIIILHLIYMLFAVSLADTVHGSELRRKAFVLSERDRSALQHFKRQKGSPATSILSGLMRSHSLVGFFNTVPCDVIQTLTTDEQAAQNFLDQVLHGQAPSAITSLPSEILSGMENLVSVVTAIPSEVLNNAEAAVTDVVSIFNAIETGGIVSELGDFASVVTSEAGSFWAGVTDAGKDLLCFIEQCTSTSAPDTNPGSCFQQNVVVQTSYVSTSTTAAAATTNVAAPTLPASSSSAAAGTQPSSEGRALRAVAFIPGGMGVASVWVASLLAGTAVVMMVAL